MPVARICMGGADMCLWRENVGGSGGILLQEILKKICYLRQYFVCFEEKMVDI